MLGFHGFCPFNYIFNWDEYVLSFWQTVNCTDYNISLLSADIHYLNTLLLTIFNVCSFVLGDWKLTIKTCLFCHLKVNLTFQMNLPSRSTFTQTNTDVMFTVRNYTRLNLILWEINGIQLMPGINGKKKKNHPNV